MKKTKCREVSVVSPKRDCTGATLSELVMKGQEGSETGEVKEAVPKMQRALRGSSEVINWTKGQYLKTRNDFVENSTFN